MDPMGRMYGGMEDWRAGAYSAPADYGAYAGYQGPGRFGRDIDYRYGPYRQYDRGFEEETGDWRRLEGGEHTWRGGLLGWLGSGLRAGAAWIGNRMQSWGGLLGGKLQGTTAELGRAMRGRGEQDSEPPRAQRVARHVHTVAILVDEQDDLAAATGDHDASPRRGARNATRNPRTRAGTAAR